MNNEQGPTADEPLDENLSFGYWVRRRRKSLDLTQVELAKEVGCTESLIRKIESDQRRPSRQMAAALAAALQIPAAQEPLFLGIARAELGLSQLAALDADGEGPLPSRPARSDPMRPISLPADVTLFIGREQDLADIERRLLDPACRLLTLVGPGGMGKTRLAIQAARRLAQNHATAFADGLFFVPLESVTTTAGIVTAIAEVAGLRFYDNIPPKTQLLDYLGKAEILLVLDNFEQLEASVDLLTEILAAAPACKMLVTSRRAVKLYASWFHPVTGLSLPQPMQPTAEAPTAEAPTAEAPTAEAGLEADAVRLFVESARRAQVNFPLEDLSEAERICRLVGGLPLAIELAAAWLNAVPIREIADELEQSLDPLAARDGTFPERQRSIRAVIESSWRRLESREADALMQIAVCRNGFRSGAAAAIAGLTRPVLATLVDHSLLRLLPSGRYVMHATIRQFAREALQQSGQATEVGARHAAYYLRFLAAEEARLTGADQQVALESLSAERDNLRLAWICSVEHQQAELLQVGLDGIYNFYHIRSLYHEGDELCGLALEAPVFDAGASAAILHARLLARRGAFRFALGDIQAAEQLLDQSLALLNEQSASQENTRQEIAFVRAVQGQLAGWQGDQPRARQYLEESLARYSRVDNQQGTAYVQHKLAQFLCSYGEYAGGRDLAEQSLRLCEAIGRPDWRAYALDVLGWATLCLGEYAAAEQHYRRSLELFEQSGDRLGVALALGGVGSVMWAKGMATLDKGTRYMEESLALCRQIGHRQHMASRLWYLAQFANEAQDFEAAQAHAEAGLALAEALDSRVFMAYNLSALGETRLALHDIAGARRYLTQAITLAADANQLPPLLIGLMRMAQVWIAENRPEDLSVEHKESRPLPTEPEGQARRLLRFVRRHPACWMPYQQRIEAILATLPAAAHDADAGGTLEDWIRQATMG